MKQKKTRGGKLKLSMLTRVRLKADLGQGSSIMEGLILERLHTELSYSPPPRTSKDFVTRIGREQGSSYPPGNTNKRHNNTSGSERLSRRIITWSTPGIDQIGLVL